MTYIQQILSALTLELPACPRQLLTYYAVLLVARGTEVSAEDAWTAFAAWYSWLEGGSLPPLEELPPSHQDVITKDAIGIAVAALKLKEEGISW